MFYEKIFELRWITKKYDVLRRITKKYLNYEKSLYVISLFLDERAYSKIYSELTKKEQEIVSAIASGKVTNNEIKELLHMKDGSLSTYKMSLSKKGIIDVTERGITNFLLPRFSEFIRFLEL